MPARIRTIKPEFFSSADIVDLTPLARLLYIGTWLDADREGRLRWRPKNLKHRYLPGDECDIGAVSMELVNAGLVVNYEVDGESFAEIPTFKKHQVINNKESASKIPPRVADATGSRGPREQHTSVWPLRQVQGEGKGGERKGTNTPPPPADAGGAFSRFWESWPTHPRKAARDKCEAKWRVKGCDGIASTVMAALDAAKTSEAWTKNGGDFIPAPLTWLNQSRWEAPTEAEAMRERQVDHWFDSRAGIEAKGAELGIGPWDQAESQLGRAEQWPAYRAKVFRAAGHSPPVQQ